MTEVATRIFNAVEELNFPHSQSTDNLSTFERRTSTSSSFHRNDTLGKLVMAVNTVGYPLGSTDSLATLGSCNSLTSMNDLSDYDMYDEDLPMKVFHAVEALTMNSYDSSSNMNSFTTVETSPSVSQHLNFLRYFMMLLEEFNMPEGASQDGEERQVFKKFC
jgi:hypothetical protein